MSNILCNEILQEYTTSEIPTVKGFNACVLLDRDISDVQLILRKLYLHNIRWRRSIICSLQYRLFMDLTNPCFLPFTGKPHFDIHSLKILVSGGAIVSAEILSIIGLNKSV